MAVHGPRAVAAILVAGGSGARLGARPPKAFVDIAGLSLLERTVSRFVHHDAVDALVVVAPAPHLAQAEAITSRLLDELSGREGRPAAASYCSTVVVVAGGSTRQASVAAGLAALGEDVEFVLVHDVARPFVPAEVIDRVLGALLDGADAVVPVVPVHDTLRTIDASGALIGHLDRSSVVAVQTPQGFRRALLVRAHAEGPDDAATDDAGLVEALGVAVVAVSGADEAFKITRPWDRTVAEAVAHAFTDAMLDG